MALEQGRDTVEAGKVLLTLMALGYDLSVTPYERRRREWCAR